MSQEIVKQQEYKDPFLQRAIEHWLDTSNELGYQPLFCEWLITQGYILKYSIKNTHFEQGKDVVAVFSDGTPCAFQLKGGSINLKRWRDEVKPEIDILIGGAIQHPDIDKTKTHLSYLVTNGEIEDNVRTEIVSLNEKAWKDTPLHVWTRGDLLSGFQNMAEGILPKDAITYKRLTDLIFADGTGLPDVPKIYAFLREILQVEDASIKKEQRKRNIAAAVLYASMIAGPYRTRENHGSVVRILTILLSLIFYVVDKYNLEDRYWLASYEIVWGDLIATAKALEDEVNTSGFDASFTTPFDTDLIPFRKHGTISVVYPLKLSQLIANDDDWKTMLSSDLAQKYKGAISVWGEASLIPFIILCLTLKDVKGAEEAAIKLIKSALSQVLLFNGRKSKHAVGLVPPYYDLDFAVKLSFGMLEEEFDDSYKLSSYLMKPLVEMLARLNQRDYIAENWQEISYMHFEEYIPTDPCDYYLWRSETGENRSALPKKEKSWSELVADANEYDGKSLPPTMKRFPAFLPFLISIFPHRANSETVGYLHKIVTK